MPAQTITAGNANFTPSCTIKLVAMATSLDRSLPNFSLGLFFIGGVNATILHPLSNERGDIKKRKS